MSKSLRFGFSYLSQHQIGKDVLVNGNFDKIDRLMWLFAESIGLKSPPESPVNYSCYIVGLEAVDDWSGRDNLIAINYGSAGWDYIIPNAGLLIYVKSEEARYEFNGSVWRALSVNSLSSSTDLHNVPTVGINSTSVSDKERLVVNSLMSSFTSSSDARVRINKGVEDGNSSLLYSSSSVSKAEVGLLGNDDFSVAVSSDGSVFHQGFSVDSSSGRFSIKNGCYLSGGLQFSGSNQTLDFYDFGSWIPTLIGDKTAGHTSYSYQTGEFFRIGQMVYLNFFVSCSAVLSDASGNLSVGGLPYDPTDSANFVSSLLMSGLQNLPSGSVPNMGGIMSSKRIISLFSVNNSGYTNINVLNITPAFEIRGSFCYRTR